MKHRFFLLHFTFYIFLLASCHTNSLKVYDLRCEYLVEPPGIDNPYALEQMSEWDYEPHVSWKCNRQATFGGCQKAYRVRLARSEKDLKRENNLLWDSGIIESAELFCFLPKTIVHSHTKYYWQVETFVGKDVASKVSTFGVGLLAQDWQGTWICKGDNRKENHLWFRKNFELQEVSGTVFAYVASSGYHELYVNGAKVDARVLAPAVSRIDRRVLYVTYNISRFLRKGKNVMALAYGAGWSMNNYFEYYGKTRQALRVQVYGEDDGFSLASDSTWLCSESYSRNSGRFDFMDMGGEVVDGRKYTDRWARVDFDDSQWVNASESEDYHPTLSAQMTDFSRIMEEISARSITAIRPASGDAEGCYRVDMGKEFTGFLEATFEGLHAGDTVVIQVSMRDSSSVYVQASDTIGNQIIEEQKQRHIYIARGENGETFRNRFNFFAGRYIHFRLKPGEAQRHQTFNLRLPNIKGWVVSSAPTFTASFESSNELYNAIFAMDAYTYQMNHTEGVVTDCPNRERLGYGPEGAYQTAWGLGLPCFQSAAYYVKNVRDWADVQRPDGSINNVAPQMSDMYGGVLNGTAILNLAWEHYGIYGDRRIVEMALPVGIKWLGFLQKHVENDRLTRYDSHGYFLGEWVSPGPVFEYAETEEALFNNNCAYAMTLDYLIKMQRVNGKTQAIERWETDLQKTRNALHREYYNEERQMYLNGDQVRTAWALYAGIVPDSLREQQENHLLERLKTQGYLDIGSFGRFPFYQTVLHSDKYAEILGEILSKTSYPSYGYFLKNACTAFPEMWEIDQPNSTVIHTSYTGISAFFIQYLAGINAYACGSDTLLITPHPIDALEYCTAELETPYGRVKSSWKRENSQIKYRFEVPFGVVARVRVEGEEKMVPTGQTSEIILHKQGPCIAD
jgi:alpha-L-rhamnosidase